MDIAQIQSLLDKSLQSEQGQKLLGDNLNITDLTNRIGVLGEKLGINVSNIVNAPESVINEALTRVQDPEGNNLTREQRRQRRQERRQSRRERLEARLEEADLDPSQSVSKIAAEIKILKAKLKSQTPTFEVYKISGRLFDKSTGNPLAGVKVVPGVSPTILGEIEEAPSLNIQQQELISSRVEFDPNDLIYVPAPFLIEGNEVITDKRGNYTISFKIPIIPANQKSPLDFALLFSKGGFLPTTKTVLNGDRTVKTNLSAASVTNINETAEKLSQEFNDKIDQAQSLVGALSMNIFDRIISARKLSIAKVVDSIKTKLLPLAVSMLLAFGIAKISQANRKTCPTPASLDNVFRTRNRVVRQLNQLFSTITINTALAVAFFSLAKVLRGVRLAMDAIPTPQAIGVFPAKDFGGLIFAQPYSFTAKLQHINDELEKLEEQNEGLNKSILTSLVFLIAGCATVIILLKTIDNLLQECAEEYGAGDFELLAINQELLDLTEEETGDGNPVVKSLNGFIFSVETDNKNPAGTLKRRFAVAKNAKGVTLLKGEPSFSSNDQILIDELVFYIQQNNLKAY